MGLYHTTKEGRKIALSEEALQHLNYYQYKEELDKRLKTIKYANLQTGYY